MSRSRKRSTFVTDNHGHNLRRRFMKKYSNKSLRNKLKNSDELVQGSQYKKHFDTYDICDYRWYWSEQMAIDSYYNDYHRDWFYRKYPTLKSWLKRFRKDVVYK